MKSTISMLLLLVLMVASGCGGNQAGTTFEPSKAEKSEAATMPNSYSLNNFSFRYPVGWQTAPPLGSRKFSLVKNGPDGKFRTDLNLIYQNSDPAFAKTPLDDMKKAFTALFKASGISNAAFVKAEEGQWNGINAIYLEYKGNMLNDTFYWSQYYFDDGKYAYILTFTTTAGEWPELQKEARKIFSSVSFAK